MIRIMLLIPFLLPFICCAGGGETAATYYNASNRQVSLPVSDIRQFFKEYMTLKNKALTNDPDLIRELVMDNFLAAEFVYFEVEAAGFPRTADYARMYDRFSNQAWYLLLYNKGRELFAADMEKHGYEVVQARQILIRTGFMDDGVRSTAARLLAYLSNSRNPETAFSEAARKYSDDPASASMGGYIGYLPRGAMVKPFETALFRAERTGLLPGIIETPYGLHIVYLKTRASRMSLSQIRAREKNNRYFSQTLPLFENAYGIHCASNYFTDYYRVNDMKNSLNLAGRELRPADIPDDTPIMKLYSTGFRWRQVRELNQLFGGEKTSNVSIFDFQDQVRNFTNIGIYVARALKDRYDQDPRFIRDQKKAALKLIKKELAGAMDKELAEKAAESVSADDLEQYYAEHRETLVATNRDGRLTAMNYAQSTNRIFDIIRRDRMKTIYRNWASSMALKYSVRYNEKAIHSMISGEARKISFKP